MQVCRQGGGHIEEDLTELRPTLGLQSRWDLKCSPCCLHSVQKPFTEHLLSPWHWGYDLPFQHLQRGKQSSQRRGACLVICHSGDGQPETPRQSDPGSDPSRILLTPHLSIPDTHSLPSSLLVWSLTHLVKKLLSGKEGTTDLRLIPQVGCIIKDCLELPSISLSCSTVRLKSPESYLLK